ncbi:hypothetical protein ING2E5A_0823 [Petrimonas mucosa]|uniref:Uncharacterized protein n=1 Tax=Petrimonas mucosa TaxID=1642646 RepID=A0A1G4G552_9BACT|nr:hypothetical protein ING2E5A_0823 [Petrimonas mucosa]
MNISDLESICELIYNYFSAKFFRNNCGYTFNINLKNNER